MSYFIKKANTVFVKNYCKLLTASPDLFVKTDKGEVKINLKVFGNRINAHKKITGITVTNIIEYLV